MPVKAVFLDKDNTLVKDVPYNVNPSLVELTPGVASGLKKLQGLGFLTVVITNQSGISFGLFTHQDLKHMFHHLDKTLMSQGSSINRYYYCPHSDNDRTCHCRKPLPGLIHKAVKDLKVDPVHSWMVGDTESDIEAGRQAGCRTILFTYYGNKTKNSTSADYIAESFSQVVSIITHKENHDQPRQKADVS